MLNSSDLDIKYKNSGSTYHVSHTMLNHNQSYIVHEYVKINGG